MTSVVAAPTFDFVIFYVADLDQSCRFFAETLGFTRQPEGDGPNFRQFVDGAGRLGFGLIQSGEQSPPSGAVELYLKSEDQAALRDSWLAHGVAATPIMPRPFGPIFEITTPDGRTLTTIGA